MKTYQIFLIVTAWALTMLFAGRVFGDWKTDIIKGLRLNEFEIGGEFTSEHMNQCKPTCANQENGGFVLEWGPLAYIELINSYGDPGKVYAFIPPQTRLELDVAGIVYAGAEIWIMQIEGYYKEIKDKDCIEDDEDGGYCKRKEPIIVHPPPWPKFHIGIDPVAIYNVISGDSFGVEYGHCSINVNKIYFPGVSIQWLTLGCKIKF